MTIAACYVSNEGVVFGADSTSTLWVSDVVAKQGGQHHYNYAQKIFEFGGPHSTIGVLQWGLGSLPHISFRTLFAEVADMVSKEGCNVFDEVVKTSVNHFWDEYCIGHKDILEEAKTLNKKENLTDDEKKSLNYLYYAISGGFCIGGRWNDSRRPKAVEILFNPLMEKAPVPTILQPGRPKFWGWENLISRIMLGIDQRIFEGILTSGKWNGTQEELGDIVRESMLGIPRELPIREAIDWIYASIYTTIKTIKFSHFSPVCGGPIEVAVITTDRPFRWVRHKKLGEALTSNLTREEL